MRISALKVLTRGINRFSITPSPHEPRHPAGWGKEIDMGHMQQLIQKMQDRMERNIRSHMAEGATYAEAAAIVKSRSVAGPAVWRNLDSIFAQVMA